jgi:hypothetical protein
VQWLSVQPSDLTGGVFHEAINYRLAQGLTRSLHTETDASELFKLADQHPEFTPHGFIYHVSRCGSTLLVNMLASIAEHVVLIEPMVPSYILHEKLSSSSVSNAAALRASLVAFYQPRAGGALRHFVKFFSGNVLQVQTVREAFPGVREIFLYRDPVEVVVSNIMGPIQEWLWRQSITGLPLPEAVEMSLVELTARIVGRMMCAMLSEYREGSTLLMNYSEIGAATPRVLLDFFGISADRDALLQMESKLSVYSKDPTQQRKFERDSEFKQQRATDLVRDLAATFAYSAYNELEGLRLSRDRSDRVQT